MKWTMTLSANGQITLPKAARDRLALDAVRLRRKDLEWNALGLFKDQGLDLSAALVAAEAAAMGSEEICSYDPGFDRIAGVSRVEP